MSKQMKPQSCRDGNELNRREFIGATAAVTACMVAGLRPISATAADNPLPSQTSKIINYNADMEYRRCGKTGWMISALCLGGHWKRVSALLPGVNIGDYAADLENAAFSRNRYDVVTRGMERGMNYIDACTSHEVRAYSKALQGRRDKMHLGWSWYEKEPRTPEYRTAEKLIEGLNAGLKAAGETYVDLWRITCMMGGSGDRNPKGEPIYPHSKAESEEIAKALAMARKQGKARCTGISSHDRPWLEYMVNTFPEDIQVVVTPYTAKSKVLEKSSFFDTVKKHDCGVFGIKPFSSYGIFKGNGSPDPKKNPHIEEDNRIARMALRYILCNPGITAPIPGLASEEQVDNAALAIAERRELDPKERAELKQAMDRAWANLSPDYQWLKHWEYV